ncbi:MAG TPA: ABC transporter substrate-binding protein [Gammaproteobacteria bacterium]|jgi:iron complex transport system substrate-binding protein|nr:ABC transporter substrate-binding protein [Gammaproteobacteria bacterium]
MLFPARIAIPALSASLCIATLMVGVPDVRAQTATTEFRDDAGRTVTVKTPARRVFAAGAPAEVLLYVLAPRLLVGRNHAPSDAALPFIPPELRRAVPIQNLPNADDDRYDGELRALTPDLYVDYGTVADDYVESLTHVEARTGVPGIILDGGLARIPDVLRRLGSLLGEAQAAESLAAETERVLGRYRNALALAGKAPRVYLACSQNGLVPCLAGTPNGEAADWLGAANVAGGQAGAPRRPATLAEIAAWQPDVIIAPSPDARDRWLEDPEWAQLAAVRARRVHAPPGVPFAWGSRPPSVNRMLGLVWLAYVLPAKPFDDAFLADIRSLFRTYYHVDVTDAQIHSLVDGS